MEIEFYKTESGRVPVDEFLKGLSIKQSAKIYQSIKLLKDFGNELHYPYVESIKGEKYKGLMELRTKAVDGIFRIFYFVIVENKAVLLHAIQKKTDKTPQKELETALARMKEYRAREVK